MTVELAATQARTFHAHPRSKHFQAGQIWLGTKKQFKWRFVCHRMNKSIVQIDGMHPNAEDQYFAGKPEPNNSVRVRTANFTL
jgi:hypothetical protein